MKKIIIALFLLSGYAKASPIIQGTDLASGINISGQAIISSTVTLTGTGAQVRIGSTTQNSVGILLGDQTGTIITTTTFNKFGEAIWAKSVDGATVISTGCFVILNQGTDTTLGQEALVFTSTNTANVSTGIGGVTLDNTAAGAWGRIGIRGLFAVMATASVTKGSDMESSTTRCQMQDGTGVQRSGSVLKDSPAAGALVPAFFFQ